MNTALLLRMIARKRGVSRLLLLPASSIPAPQLALKEEPGRRGDSTISVPAMPLRRTVLDFGLLY